MNTSMSATYPSFHPVQVRTQQDEVHCVQLTTERVHDTLTGNWTHESTRQRWAARNRVVEAIDEEVAWNFTPSVARCIGEKQSHCLYLDNVFSCVGSRVSDDDHARRTTSIACRKSEYQLTGIVFAIWQLRNSSTLR